MCVEWQLNALWVIAANLNQTELHILPRRWLILISALPLLLQIPVISGSICN